LWTAADDVVAVGGADGGAGAAEADGIAALVVVVCAVVLALEELGNAVDGCGIVVGCGELFERLELRERWFEGGERVGHGESQRRKSER
jgi:hypothetical protein